MVDIEIFREYCLSKKGSEECFPFDETTLVFKVGGKMFALADIHSNPLEINLKCNPEFAIELREKYSQVKPGYHMNKKHWNTICCDSSISKKLVFSWIDMSYSLVFSSLPGKIKKTI